MARFDFKCSKCGQIITDHFVTEEQPMPNSTICEVDGNSCEWEKLFPCSVSKPIFKGSGFYETDYVRKGI